MIRGSECALRNAETWPALSVHSATWSVIQRMCAQHASRFAGSAALGLGNEYWCGIVQTTGCFRSRGIGATAKSTLASRRPATFQDPASHMPSLPAMNASRAFAFAGGATLCCAKNEPQNSAASIAAGSLSAERLRSGA